MSDTSMYTPPEIAKLFRVNNRKVLAWIRSGEMPAINVADPKSQRPRYRVSEDDLETFKSRRAVEAKPPPAPRRRRLPFPDYFG